MLSKSQIESAFKHRARPNAVTDVSVPSTLRHDALHFVDTDWRSVRAEDWNDHSDAYFGLSPDAFRYFLPSIIALSADSLNGAPIAAGQLIYSLDTSGDPTLWDDWFVLRFGLLNQVELRVVLNWARFHLEHACPGYESELQRVCDTLETLILMADD